MSPLTDFPPELLMQILSNLDKQDVARASRTCTEFNNAAKLLKFRVKLFDGLFATPKFHLLRSSIYAQGNLGQIGHYYSENERHKLATKNVNSRLTPTIWLIKSSKLAALVTLILLGDLLSRQPSKSTLIFLMLALGAYYRIYKEYHQIRPTPAARANRIQFYTDLNYFTKGQFARKGNDLISEKVNADGARIIRVCDVSKVFNAREGDFAENVKMVADAEAVWRASGWLNIR
tara:strand:- start:302 stop:1000 length:699 start_codon:yes stop_codon:yes gene_type:complete